MILQEFMHPKIPISNTCVGNRKPFLSAKRFRFSIIISIFNFNLWEFVVETEKKEFPCPTKRHELR